MTLRTALLGGAALCLGTAAAAQDSELTVLDYPGFEDPVYHQQYVEQHGESPTYSFFGDEEEAFQKVVAGFQADATQICAGSVNKWVESGIVEPWDLSRIPVYDDLNADLTGQDVRTGGEDVYFIPQNYGATAIAYNPDEVPEEDVQTLDVFTNPKYQGRVSMPDNVDDAFALAYLATGTTNWVDATDEEFDAAVEWLRQAHPNMRTYWTDPAELIQLMSTGEVLVSWAWNETYPSMVAEDRPIAYEREPEEGSSLWLCGYVNMADGGGSEDKVYDFINAVLDPSATEALLVDGFGHANAAAMADIDEAELEAAGLGPLSEDTPVLAQLPISNDQRERHAEAFEMIKAGF